MQKKESGIKNVRDKQEKKCENEGATRTDGRRERGALQNWTWRNWNNKGKTVQLGLFRKSKLKAKVSLLKLCVGIICYPLEGLKSKLWSFPHRNLDNKTFLGIAH